MNPSPKNKINLFKLPKWQQYGIALLVVVSIVVLAVISRGDKPPPPWIMERLIPILGWVYLTLLAVVIVRFVLTRKNPRD